MRPGDLVIPNNLDEDKQFCVFTLEGEHVKDWSIEPMIFVDEAKGRCCVLFLGEYGLIMVMRTVVELRPWVNVISTVR